MSGQRQIPIKLLPFNLCVEVLHKMPLNPFLKMRKTSKFIDSFMERNKKKFASRTYFAVPMNIWALSGDVRPRFNKPHKYCNDCAYCWHSVDFVDEDFERRVSGIPICTLTVESKTYGRGRIKSDQYRLIIEALKNAKLVCYEMHVFDIPLKYLPRMVKHVTTREIKMVCREGSPNAFIQTLGQANNPERFVLRVRPLILDSSFVNIRKFSFLEGFMYTYALEGLFWNIYLCEENFNITRLKLKVMGPALEGVERPPIETLWSYTILPPNYDQFFDGDEILRCIYLMRLEKKYALIITTWNGNFMKYDIFFKEKNLERTLDFVFGMLAIRPLSDAESDEILTVGEERRAQIIADAYLERFRAPMMQPRNNSPANNN